MHTNTNRIPIATAAEVAARLPAPHSISGGWYRTSTAICHGGDHKTALSFQNGDRPGDSPLRVHCHSHNCDPAAIRHALQQATGLWLCRCDACFAAFRAGRPPPGTDATPPQGAQRTSGRLRPPEWTNRYLSPKNTGNGAQGRSAPAQGKDTNAYAAALWAVAHASTTGPAPQHPAAKWLADRSLWPPAEPLPAAVRWLPRSHRQFPRGRPDSTAAGALVMAMRPLDDPTAPPRKIQLVTIDKAGPQSPPLAGQRRQTHLRNRPFLRPPLARPDPGRSLRSARLRRPRRRPAYPALRPRSRPRRRMRRHRLRPHPTRLLQRNCPLARRRRTRCQSSHQSSAALGRPGLPRNHQEAGRRPRSRVSPTTGPKA